MTFPSIICLMGPTASGKTHLALELIKKFPCDIISVDSGMIYRNMDIGTAKPSKVELRQAPHRLIDILDPKQSYSAAQFRSDALREIAAILQAGRIPLLVGGTMLYFKVLQQGISKLPSADKAIRAKITAEIAEQGLIRIYKKLQAIDPETASRISSNDVQRIQRALEIYELTGKSMSKWLLENPPEPLPYKTINIAIEQDRSVLEDRIKQRLQLMLEQDFVAEVEALFNRNDLSIDLPAMRSVGYRQVWRYLDGEYDYATMQQKIIIATRQLAKRQLTWLRAWEDLKWFTGDDRMAIVEYIYSNL